MASTLEGPPSLPPMPDFSAHNNPFSTAGDMKFHLQSLLDVKEKQLQQAGTLGQRVLAQRVELEERIRQLQEIEADKGEDDEIDPEARDRYRELADTVLAWDAENAQLSNSFGGSSKRHGNGNMPSPSMLFADLPREESERPKASGASAAQSRRAKNAAHRADDVEFALEIGSGLLTEVRRLQSLLGERDKAIQDMKEEKDDLEKTVESLRTALKQQEQSTDKFKEENWNLEVTLQELRTQLSDFQASTQRLESEHKRLTKAFAASRDAGDQHKNECERLQQVIEGMKAKHETDVAQARRHAASLARDKSDLQQTIDQLKTEATRAARRLPRFGSPVTPNGPSSDDFHTPANGEDGGSDIFGTTGGASTNRRKLDNSSLFPPDEFAMDDYLDSPEQSPLRKPFLAPNHPKNEIEALQQRLAHAQRQINTLKGSLNREKQARMRLENASPAKMPFGEQPDEDADDFMDEDTAAALAAAGAAESKRPKRVITPFKVRGGRGSRGRGRGGRGITLIQRLGMAAQSPSSEYNDDDRPLDDSSPPPVPAIPIRFSQAGEDEEQAFFNDDASHEQEDDRQRSPSPPPNPPSNRSSIVSVDGMDPAFANVLKRVPSNGSSYAGSPLRQILHRGRGGTVGSRRSRGGGVAYKEARPPSLVDAPEALSAELSEFSLDGSSIHRFSLIGSPMKGQDIAEEEDKKETAEIGCQTEPQAEDEKTDASKTTVEFGIQHDVPVRVENGVQAEFVSPRHSRTFPPSLPSSISTDPSRRTTITQYDLSRKSLSSMGDTTITRNFLAEAHDDEDEDDGDMTETGADTDADEYHDARASIIMSTPSESQEDFHSLRTMTDNDYSDSDDDLESISASRMSSRVDVSRTPSSAAHYRAASTTSFYEDALQSAYGPIYESVGTETDPLQPVVEIRTVEKVVEVPVEKIVEVPVEKIVEVPVEKIVEVPVEKIVEVFVDKIVEVPVDRIVEVQVEKVVEVPVEKVVEKIIKVPVETIIEKVVGVPVEKIVEVTVEKVVEKIVEVPVDKIVEGPEKIIEIPVEKVVEKIVEVPVEKIVEVVVEKTVDKIVEVTVEKIVEVPVEKVVEKKVEVPVEKILEVPVEKIVERRVEVPIERIVEKIVEKIVDRPVEKLVEKIVEVQVPAPKPTVSEMSIQTDPPTSPAPTPLPTNVPVFSPIPRTPPSSTAAIQTSPGLYRVGSANHQFQFIPPPPLSSASSASPVPVPVPASAPGAAGSIPTPLSGVFREPSGTFGLPRTTASDRRQSIESAISSIVPGEDASNRSRVSSTHTGLLGVVDKSKPPTMMLPPPPKAPPPPSSMPPPAFIPERRALDDRPPRPSSPPPAELIQRATTPTFGSVLNVPGRTHGSMPPSQNGLKQPPSTSSFRSAAHAAAAYAQRGLASPGPLASFPVRERDKREFSTTSLTSDKSAMASPRSSMSSDHHLFNESSLSANKTADITPNANGQATDPAVIHAITQTMIGEFLYKYTRRTIGKGHGQTRHKRFFWVHPYTKTLYWSSLDPGSSNVAESSAKSAYIEGVRSVLDPNPMPPGLHQYSVVVSTPQREMKITAPTKERHDIWLNALKYLLSRPSPGNLTSPANNTVMPVSPAASNEDDERLSRMMSSPRSQRGTRNGDTWNVTPRGQRSRSQLSVKGSVGKRSGTPAAEYLRWNGPESPYSPTKSFVDVPGGDDDDLDFELHGDSRSDEGFEGLENVRACCDGRHTVGHSGKHHHHHHHHHDHSTIARRTSSDSQHLHPNPEMMIRPVSPAWSLRSRTGSARSGEGGGGIFGWGRGDDGKLRFGSKRSTKASVPVAD